MSKDVMLVNNDIRFSEVRCVDNDGSAYGVISLKDALAFAQAKGLDLVCISPNATPPVCKIMDYDKYRYQLEKKQKEAKKKQKQIDIKEIKLSAHIAQNDINYKIKHAKEFIASGKHVRFKVVLKGREANDPQLGITVLQRVNEMMQEVAQSEKEPKTEGRFISWLFTPKR